MGVPQSATYQPYIIEFFRFNTGCEEFQSNHVFTREQIREIQPNYVKRWMACKAYNDPDYDISHQVQDEGSYYPLR
jgi:hypothetical protein